MKYKLTPVIFFNHCFDKRRFNSFFHWFFKKSHHGHYRLLKFLEKIKLIGFHSATEAGFSISIEDLITEVRAARRDDQFHALQLHVGSMNVH